MLSKCFLFPRQALKAALSNLDWRCSWDEEVQTGVGAVSMVSTAGEEIMTKKNYISWKSQRCFAQVKGRPLFLSACLFILIILCCYYVTNDYHTASAC